MLDNSPRRDTLISSHSSLPYLGTVPSQISRWPRRTVLRCPHSHFPILPRNSFTKTRRRPRNTWHPHPFMALAQSNKVFRKLSSRQYHIFQCLFSISSILFPSIYPIPNLHSLLSYSLLFSSNRFCKLYFLVTQSLPRASFRLLGPHFCCPHRNLCSSPARLASASNSQEKKVLLPWASCQSLFLDFWLPLISPYLRASLFIKILTHRNGAKSWED